MILVSVLSLSCPKGQLNLFLYAWQKSPSSPSECLSLSGWSVQCCWLCWTPERHPDLTHSCTRAQLSPLLHAYWLRTERGRGKAKQRQTRRELDPCALLHRSAEAHRDAGILMTFKTQWCSTNIKGPAIHKKYHLVNGFYPKCHKVEGMQTLSAYSRLFQCNMEPLATSSFKSMVRKQHSPFS